MKTLINKVIRNGKVAVLVSPGYGSGWSHGRESAEAMVFCPELVEAIERDTEPHTLQLIAETLFSDEYLGGLDDVVIEWVDVGRKFRITEYDGFESIEFADKCQWFKG